MDETNALSDHFEVVHFAATQISDCLDAALDRDLTNDAPVVALVARSKEIVGAVMTLLDTADEKDINEARNVIYLGMGRSSD